MSFDRAFLELMPQSVTVRTLSSKNSDGSANYTTSASTYRARVVNTNQQTRDLQGNVTQARYIAYIASTGVLSAQSRYSLPDGSTPPVLNVSVYPDEDGNVYNRVMFGYS